MKLSFLTKARSVSVARLTSVLFCAISVQLFANSKALILQTEVREVSSSSINGMRRLMLELGSVTGPVGCQNNRVLMPVNPNRRTSEMEAIALSALLNSESVLIRVPTDSSKCIDGKPTVTALWLADG